MVENVTGVISTVILAAGIGFLTLRGFHREATNLKNGGCCSSGSCCGCDCGGHCHDQHDHQEDPKQNPGDNKKT